MHRHLRTLSYFMSYGTLYGFLLSILAGSLIVPILGSFVAVPFGLGIGLILGTLTGIITLIYNAIALNFDTDLVQYRRRLTLGIGTFTAISSVILMLSSLELSGVTFDGFTLTFIDNTKLALVLSAFFWSGLASANAASHYADWYMKLVSKQKNDEPLPTIKYGSELSPWYGIIFFPFGLLLFMGGSIAGVAWNLLLPSTMNNTADIVGSMLGGGFLTALILAILTVANSFAFGLTFRIVFQEYRFTRRQYRFGMAAMSFMLTLSIGLVWYFFVGIIPSTEPAFFLIVIMVILFTISTTRAAYLTALREEHLIYGTSPEKAKSK